MGGPERAKQVVQILQSRGVKKELMPWDADYSKYARHLGDAGEENIALIMKDGKIFKNTVK